VGGNIEPRYLCSSSRVLAAAAASTTNPKEWCQCYQLGNVVNGLTMARFAFATVMGFHRKNITGTLAVKYLEKQGEKMPFPANVTALATLATAHAAL
jgi:hypothetical protein